MVHSPWSMVDRVCTRDSSGYRPCG